MGKRKRKRAKAGRTGKLCPFSPAPARFISPLSIPQPAKLRVAVIFLWDSGARDSYYERNEGASPRKVSYFNFPRACALQFVAASPLTASEIGIARSTIPKKNNNCSQSTSPPKRRKRPLRRRGSWADVLWDLCRNLERANFPPIL